MARIKQRDSALELAFRRALWREGVRYRKNARAFGTPDLLFSSARLVVFIDSCFWHGCHHHCRKPKSNVVFWEEKLRRNRERDKLVTRHYRDRGWRVMRFWEHQLVRDQGRCIQSVLGHLRAV